MAQDSKKTVFDRLRWPFGQFSFGTAALVAGALIVLAGAFTTAYTVEPEERAVVTRFGELKDVRGPGLHFKLPFGIDVATRVPTERVLKQEFGFR